MGSQNNSLASANPSRALHRFAVISATATFALIFIGGLVTSTGSALAVPDWPLAFGHLIPQLSGGVRFEYGHRVAAGIVVILTLTLALWTWMAEPRPWVRTAALAALGIILLQAILGGITVLYLLPLPIAVAHAGMAQALCSLMVAMALFTNPRFGTYRRIRTNHERPRLVTLTAITSAVIYLQILVGAVMRHLGAGLAIPDFPASFGHLVPPLIALGVEVNFAHRCGAVVVSGFILWAAIRIFRRHRDQPQLTHPAILLLLLLAVQISLGALTIWSGRAVIPTTAHVAVGAGVLATSVALTIRAFALCGMTAVAEATEYPGGATGTIEGRMTA